MDFFFQLFFTVNLLLWVAQALLDIKFKHIHPYLSYLSILTAPLVMFDLSLTSFILLSLVPIVDFTGYMARGDTKLMLQYIISTIPVAILGLQTILFTTAMYILIQETILKNENYPMAPAPLTAFLAAYLLPLLL